MNVQELIIKTISEKCARFLKNIGSYQRDSVTGIYPHVWTGDSVRMRITPNLFQEIEDKIGFGERFELVIAGQKIGEVELWKPLWYPDLFLVLWLDTKYQFNTNVIRRFGKMGGYNKHVNEELLAITQIQPDLNKELIF